MSELKTMDVEAPPAAVAAEISAGGTDAAPADVGPLFESETGERNWTPGSAYGALTSYWVDGTKPDPGTLPGWWAGRCFKNPHVEPRVLAAALAVGKAKAPHDLGPLFPLPANAVSFEILSGGAGMPTDSYDAPSHRKLAEMETWLSEEQIARGTPIDDDSSLRVRRGSDVEIHLKSFKGVILGKILEDSGVTRSNCYFFKRLK